MRNIILNENFHKIDFNPSLLLQQYLTLTKQDVEKYFLHVNQLKTSNCAACGTSQVKDSFVKFGMTYQECNKCESLYISPRPTDQALIQYYRDASAEQYWRNEIYSVTAKKRKSKIIDSRCQWIGESTQEYLPDAQHLVDIYNKQLGYLKSLSKIPGFKIKTLIHPFLSEEEINANPEFQVFFQNISEVQIPDTTDVVIAFETINRVSNLGEFFRCIHKILKKDGLCFLTAILSTGFDLQILGDKAENLFPPDRLNVFSVEGLKMLFQQYDFECLEFSTPGILDIENIENTLENNPTLEIPKFLKYFLKKDSNTKQAFQEFLQTHLLSSYGRILLRKV